MLRLTLAAVLAVCSCTTAMTPPPDAGVVVCASGVSRCSNNPNMKQQAVLRCNDAGTHRVQIAHHSVLTDGTPACSVVKNESIARWASRF